MNQAAPDRMSPPAHPPTRTVVL
eukprot:COSAG06_NODE_47829_length_336_cov_1.253165_1_plen_22_part_10